MPIVGVLITDNNHIGWAKGGGSITQTYGPHFCSQEKSNKAWLEGNSVR
jgi:hypothetical protein